MTLEEQRRATWLATNAMMLHGFDPVRMRRGDIHRFPDVREESRNVRYGAGAPLHGFGLPGAVTTSACRYASEGVVQVACRLPFE
jgi:hypothetical protein